MTTDPTPLQERIAAAWNGLTPEEWAAMDHEKHGPGLKRLALRDAAAVLPIIAAEVRKAQADAWDEGQASGWDEAQEQWQINGAVGDMWKHADTPNPYREKED